jgi:hypothetical protein
MTRFKELQRIEDVIKHRNTSELEWALDYCKMRLGIALRKDHQKHWRNLGRKVQDAITQAQAEQT